jgi:site-specific recombinase XerD
MKVNNKISTRVTSLKELITLYERSNRAEGKSEKTICWYSEILALLYRYFRENGLGIDISSFNINTVRDYILYLRKKPKYEGHPFTPKQDVSLSPETIKCHTRGLKAFSTWLYTDGYTTENRLKNLKMPKAPRKIVEPLTPEEINSIADSIDRRTTTGYRNYAILMIALDNGLRASEIAGISLSKVNLQAGYIKVMGKGAKERTVPVGKFVSTVLWQYINTFRPKPMDSECDYLLLSRNGKPITVNTIKLVFSRLAKTSGVRRLHAHLCRHTFAINYLLNGGDIFSLKEILGHTTLEMVNHYLHFTGAQITAQHHKYSPIDRLKGEAV